MIVVMLQSLDSEEICIDPKWIPDKSFLKTLITGSSQISVIKTESGAIKVEFSSVELRQLKIYLETGVVQEDQLESLLKTLDFMGIYNLRSEYPGDFCVIKLKEDWFRRNFSTITDLSNLTYDLIELNDEKLSEYDLAWNIHYMYSKSMSVEYEGSNDDYYQPNYVNFVNLENLLTKVRISKTEKDNIQQRMYHTYSRPNVRIDSIEAMEKIKYVDNQFCQRDAEFNHHLIRERVGYRRPYHSYTNDLTILPNWKQTYVNVIARLREIELCKLLTKYNMWNNILLGGGSVTNAILDNNIRTDYDFFIYGLSEEEANAKIRKCLEVLCQDDQYCCHKISRSTHSITCGREYQFILRIYSSISEILHGFDVDSCCTGFDGKNVYLTRRADYALKHMINVVDFDRMSPTYETRLIKYMSRGFSVYVPDFSWDQIAIQKIPEYVELMKFWRNKIEEVQWQMNTKSTITIGSLTIMDLEQEVEFKKEKAEVLRKLKSERREALSPLQGIEKIIYSYFYRINLSNSDYAEKGKYDEYSEELPINYRINGKGQVVYYEITIRTKKELSDKLNSIFNFPDMPKSTILPTKVEWKTTAPGDQVTSTFHQLVLNDLSTWYKCRFKST